MEMVLVSSPLSVKNISCPKSGKTVKKRSRNFEVNADFSMCAEKWQNSSVYF